MEKENKIFCYAPLVAHGNATCKLEEMTVVHVVFNDTWKKTINKQGTGSREKQRKNHASSVKLTILSPSGNPAPSLSLYLQCLLFWSKNEPALEPWREHEVGFSSWAIKTCKLYSSLFTFALTFKLSLFSFWWLKKALFSYCSFLFLGFFSFPF